MKTRAATALRGALRRPSAQDAALAALLAGGTLALSRGAGDTAGWPWWVLAAVCVAAVAVRRRWPVPALVAASLAAVGHMALAAGPALVDLAVPVLLFTIAAERRRAVSLAFLGGALAVTAAWSVYVAQDGETDGWTYSGVPLGAGGEERRPAVPRPEAVPQDPPPAGEVPSATGPTAWGGIPVLGSLLVVAWAVGWGVQSRRAYLGELRAREADREREHEQQAALAVAAERARLTREVHDVVAHGLAVIVMQAQGGAAAFARRPDDTLAALDTIVATGRSSLADLRHVLSASGELDGPARPTAGLAHLPRLADRVRRAGTPVELTVGGQARPLPTGIDVSSYRIVQEALTNTLKHAGPHSTARVTVSYGSDALTIEVTDDGVGPSAPAVPGNGLRGMRERAVLLGGELTAGPGPEGGFAVRARIPCPPGETA